MKTYFGFKGIFSVLLVFTLCNVQAAETKFVNYDTASVEHLKSALNEGKASRKTVEAYQNLLVSANTLLDKTIPSVVNKTLSPPTGNKHDYLSISRYWWPDPTKKDGLPWVRKDGFTNPDTQTDAVDRNRLGRMTNMVHILSLSYYLSGNEQYAEKAASVLKAWFIHPDTKMNPHLQFAQSVPGNPNGRRSGILDGRLISEYVLDAIHILSQSEHWSMQNTLAINAWLTEYLTWLTKSELGKQGAKQTNNHGSWYFFQVASLAYYLNNQSLLTNTIEKVKFSYEYQFDEQGKQVHELARTRSFFYSCFNIDAITRVALIADKFGMPFWRYESSNGSSLSLALEFLLPAIQGADWPYKTAGIDPMDIAPLLVTFDKQSANKKYANILRKLIKNLGQTKEISGKHSTQYVLDQLALFEPQYLYD